MFERYETTQQRQSWTCTACGHHVHPTAGTIFHKSSTSLHLWFYAMYLMTSTRCGISAKQLERELGVTYKTAWRMFNLIRNELMTQDTEKLGAVEIDETYVGGSPGSTSVRRRDGRPKGRGRTPTGPRSRWSARWSAAVRSGRLSPRSGKRKSLEACGDVRLAGRDALHRRIRRLRHAARDLGAGPDATRRRST